MIKKIDFENLVAEKFDFFTYKRIMKLAKDKDIDLRLNEEFIELFYVYLMVARPKKGMVG